MSTCCTTREWTRFRLTKPCSGDGESHSQDRQYRHTASTPSRKIRPHFFTSDPNSLQHKVFCCIVRFDAALDVDWHEHQRKDCSVLEFVVARPGRRDTAQLGDPGHRLPHSL